MAGVAHAGCPAWAPPREDLSQTASTCVSWSRTHPGDLEPDHEPSALRSSGKGDRMPYSIIGLLAGLLLGIAAAAGGLTGFLLALVLGALGCLIGSQLDGQIDLGRLMGGRRRD